MMKFILENIKNGCRKGVLSEFGHHGNKTVETPMCMLYARSGSAPHLTADVLNKIERIPAIAHIPINTLADHHEAVYEYQKGLGRFTAMQNHIIYCSVHDASTEVPSGYNEKSGVAVWGKGGKTKVDVDLFMKIQEAFQPDFYEILYDGDTQKDSSRKRATKSVDRTLNFLDKILEKHKESERLKNVDIFGAIVGGYSEQERIQCARETSARPVAGFSLQGFHNCGPQTENFKLDDVWDFTMKTLECLPDDKPRLLHSILPPDEVMRAVEMGIDMFDSTYPYVVTERGSALTFKYNYDTENSKVDSLASGFEISLKEKRYCEDFTPVLEGCTCYTCTTFTKAYINHLLNTSEMLSRVLLMIHNFHHYFEFFHCIRNSITDGKFQELKDLVSKQKLSNDDCNR